MIKNEKEKYLRYLSIFFLFYLVVNLYVIHDNSWPLYMTAYCVVAIMLTLIVFFVRKIPLMTRIYSIFLFFFLLLVLRGFFETNYLALYMAIGVVSVCALFFRSTKLINYITVMTLTVWVVYFGRIYMDGDLAISLQEIGRMLSAVIFDMILIYYAYTSDRLQDDSSQSTDNGNKKSYLINMSHEIRTPMNAIVGLAEILLKRAKDPEDREYLHSMESASQNLLMTVNNILDYDSILTGDIKISNEPYEIVSLIYDVVNITKINLGDNAITFLVDADPNLPRKLQGDPVRIKQVLIHLLSNAVKFTKKGYITLSVRYEREGDNALVRFSVKDTGIGISQEIMDKVFLPYEQGNASSIRNADGLGIGLTIGRILLDLMSSKLQVETKENQGTEFFFVLKQRIKDESPSAVLKETSKLYACVFMEDERQKLLVTKCLHEMKVEAVALANLGDMFIESGKHQISHLLVDYQSYLQVKGVEEVRQLGARLICLVDSAKQIAVETDVLAVRKPVYFLELAVALSNKERGKLLLSEDLLVKKESFAAPGSRILVVDDNAINLRVTEGLLKPYQMSVDTALNGEEAIRLINKTKYDLVLMDHMMPGMDGIEVTKIVRSNKESYFQELPILALSANALEGAREMFTEAGMNDFIAKPIEIGSLEKALKKWLPDNKIQTVSRVFEQISAMDKGLMPMMNRVDVNIGLSYTGGNFEMYRGILRDFVMSMSKKRQLLCDLVEAEDVNTYTIEVHSMKSIARTIGATALSEKAKEMERYGHQREFDSIKAKNPELLMELDAVAQDLQPFAEEESIHIKRIPLDRVKVMEHLGELFYAIDDFDYDKAEKIVFELGNYKYDDNVEKIYCAIKERIDDIDYDNCRKKTVEMMAYL